MYETIFNIENVLIKKIIKNWSSHLNIKSYLRILIIFVVCGKVYETFIWRKSGLCVTGARVDLLFSIHYLDDEIKEDYGPEI